MRPIAVGITVLTLAGKLLLGRYQDEAAAKLAPEQLVVGVKRGAELIVHRLRSWASRALPDHFLLQLDFRNAFNTVLREALLQAIKEQCPWFLAYAKACYGSAVRLFSVDGLLLFSREGVQQGDPCGPLFFAVAIAALTRSLSSVPGIWSVWFLDDGHLAGPRSTLNDLLPIIERKQHLWVCG